MSKKTKRNSYGDDIRNVDSNQSSSKATPMTHPSTPIEALLAEKRSFPPSEDFRSQAILRDAGIYAKANKDPEAFWGEAAQSLDWFQKWDKVMDWDDHLAKWFVGGKINVSIICLELTDETRLSNEAAIGRIGWVCREE